MANVVFRRIRGRIVPIKQGGDKPKKLSDAESKKRLVQGAVTSAAGAAVGVGSGALASHMLLESAKAENYSRTLAKKFRTLKDSGPMFAKAAANTGQSAAAARASSMRLFQNRLKVLKVGRFASAALLGVGIQRLYQGATKRDSSVPEEIAGSAAGSAAAYATFLPYYRSLGLRGSSIVKAATRNIKGLTAKTARIPKKAVL